MSKRGRQSSRGAPKPLPNAAELTSRIARCIGIWETNRGGDYPAPKESSLDTVAGIHASMATIEQATTPYAVDAFARFKSLRSAASPALIAPEVAVADACCKAVTKLLSSVDRTRKTPEHFIRDNASKIEATFLDDGDVRIMFRAVVLKSKIVRLRAEVRAGKKTLAQAVSSIRVSKRLGLGRGSLKSYIRTARNWGENRAGWQRKAVLAIPDQVGTRIETVAVSKNGTALAIPVIRHRVDVQLAKRPRPTEQQLVVTVARQNNPREANYGENVLKTYNRLFP